MTPGGLRAAIARAVMQVAPDKARKRREDAAKVARVERWAEDSGNAALVGRELPPAEVLAADQRVTWWARQLRKAGLDGSMDELRARAYLDLLLGMDSRPRQDGAAGPRPERRAAGGFAGRVNLTVRWPPPPAWPTGPARSPGSARRPVAGPRPAAAAARNPRTWCLTVTDRAGRPIGHGCARPEPEAPPETRRTRRPGRTRVHVQPATAGDGTWRLSPGSPGAGRT